MDMLHELLTILPESKTRFVSPEKDPSNIIIIYLGICVSSYYLTIVSNCWLPLSHKIETIHFQVHFYRSFRNPL